MSVGKIKRGSRRRSLARSRGVISIIGAIFAAALVVAALGALDVGNVFLARRTLQRTADLAAIAGAQTINAPSAGAPAGDTPGCSAAKAAANASAASNAFVNPPTVVCGRWDPAMTAAPPYFASAVATNVPQNAVQVTVSRNVPTLFVGPSRTLDATAIAKATNIASFSLSTQAAQLQGGVLNALLTQTLGTSVNLQIGDYTSILGGQIKLLDLTKQLNAQGDITAVSVNTLLGASVTAADLLNAMATVLSNSGTDAGVSAGTALGKIAVGVSGSTKIAISTILGVTLANPDSAASTYVNALDLLTSVALANGTSQIDLTAAFTGSTGRLSSGIRLLPAGKGTKVKLVVGTPPQIVIGEAGQDANGNWRTQAHTADIALFADLYVSVLPPALSSILGGAPLTFELPLYVEGFQATAPLVSTQCGSTPELTNMNVSVSPGIAHAIISNDVKTLMASTSTQDYLNYMHGPTYQQPASILTLALGSIPVLGPLLPPALATVSLSIGSAPNGSGTPTQGFSLSVQPPASQSLTFEGVGSLNAFQPTSGQANSNQIGAQAGDLLGQLITALSPQSAALYATLGTQTYPLSTLDLGSLLKPVLSAALGGPFGSFLGMNLSAILNTVLAPITTVLTGLTTTLLQPLLTSFDTLIVPLLQLLGVQIGIATVHAISLQCGEAQLVQ
ncbi:TadG family pilus assembly protein [Paraburkholderia sp. RL17-337-BIB-A]|uniref:TadG family pilus assembly protein n=1 Tax=Paraburkholderia sp. RL17-337-BIB-A TaxID=3031636 RepID=UPI0038BAD187